SRGAWARAPHAARALAARPHARHRAAPLLLAEQRAAHVVEKAARRLLLLGRSAFELQDARVGALQGLVLYQRGLHQRVDGVRRLPQAIGDGALGVGIARGVLELGKAAEQFVDELAFLRRHGRFSRSGRLVPAMRVPIMLGGRYGCAMAAR